MKITLQRKSSARTTREYEYIVKPRFWRKNEPYEGWSGNGFTALHIDWLLNSDSKFIIALHAQPGEMESWLEHYAADHPKEAILLLAKALQIAGDKLKEQSNEKEKGETS